MLSKSLNLNVRPTAAKAAAPAPSKTAAAARSKFPKDEMSTGRASAARRAAQKAIRAPVLPPGQDYVAAFEHRVAVLRRALANGVPGAKEELAHVLRDRAGVQSAITDVERQLARAKDPAERAELLKKLEDLRVFGVKVAKMNPTERQNLQNFFRLAKEDPEGLKRFIAGVQAAEAQRAAPVQPAAPTTARPGIQAAIDFGLSQLGAPYVGGASPFRFGTPGNGRTYQMQGQKPYVSPLGVVGYDCSGFMVTMLRKAGIDLKGMDSSREMKAGLPQVPKNQLQPGDLLVKNGHVAMYIGNGQMIESVPGGVKVSAASKYINDPAYTGHRPG
jgi:cell wall-associated NlpC family hydrolase